MFRVKWKKSTKEMAEGTHTKQIVTRLEAMEMGLRQTQEELGLCWEENTTTNAATREAVQSLEKEIANLGHRIEDVFQDALGQPVGRFPSKSCVRTDLDTSRHPPSCFHVTGK